MNLVCRMLSRVYKMAHFSLSWGLLENQGCVVDFVMWEGPPLTTHFRWHGRLCRTGSRDKQSAGTRQLEKAQILVLEEEGVLSEWCGIHGSSGKPVSAPSLHGHALAISGKLLVWKGRLTELLSLHFQGFSAKVPSD